MGEHEITGWFATRIPEDLFTERPTLEFDREEIQIVGPVGAPPLPDDATGESISLSQESRIAAWREATRSQRMRIARDAQRRFGKVVSWGARSGDTTLLFTTASVPVMTRLRLNERRVLDTLIDGGVARSRSDALAWCVRLVASKQEVWLDELREALTSVERVRAEGPNPV
jgi:hypothetical protein